MPRQTKRSETIQIPLDIASGKISKAMEIYGVTTLLRIRQAISRHPDLSGLLGPVAKELEDQERQLRVAKSAVSTAKSLIRTLKSL